MIREARPTDEQRLKSIQQAALDEPWLGLLDVAIDGPPLVLVVTDDGPVGYALVVPDHPVAYLAELAVAPSSQGAGYGTLLLGSLLDRLRADGVQTLRLTTRADDERLRAFYDRFGFETVREIPDHYRDGDGVLLEASLD